MEDEEFEDEEEDEGAGPERAGRKGKRWLPIVAIVVAVLVVTALGVYFVTRNLAPTADFSYQSTDLHLAVSGANSTDADGDPLFFAWSWGDGAANGSGITDTHDYAAVGTYTVTLTVTDGRGGVGTAPKSIKIQILPTPLFIARQYGMTTTFDASASLGSPGHTVGTYSWSFGDGNTGSGMQTSHTYATPGRYTVSLAVTDDAGLSNTATRYVSANTTTVDVLGSQFFTAGCPYQDYWYLRHNTYGDVVLNGTVPCRDFYPWILYPTGSRGVNPSWVYTLWRVDMIATNNLGYSVVNPVYLPAFNTSVAPAADSYVDMNLTFNYLNRDANLSDPLNINYWDRTQWAVSATYSDGYGYLVRGNLTMDATEAQRIFDVGSLVPFGPSVTNASDWVDPDNAFISDQHFTYSNVSGNTSVYGGYGIPQTAGAAIQQVQVGVQGYGAGTDAVHLDFSTDGGSTWTSAGNVSFTKSNATTFIDVTSARSWTPSLLNDTNFRTRIVHVPAGSTPGRIYVDWVPVRVKGSTAAWWWAGSTRPGRQIGPLERRFDQWLEALGNGKYYTYNAFQWQYQTDITDLNATVSPDGTTRVQVFWDGWGYDVLFDRMSYWGAQNYSTAVNAPYGGYPPRGWMPFETCWCENVTINATIRNSLNMHYVGTSEYWFDAVGNPGQDGILNDSLRDDLPGWSWAPSLMDYVPPAGSSLPGASTYPDSELRWYVSHTTAITSPGSYGYGTQYEYMVTPDRWNMSLGNTITLEMPTFSVPWYDPVRSVWNGTKLQGDYAMYFSRLTLRLVSPGGSFWLWDARGKVLSVAAPAGFTWPDTGLPLTSEPYIEFGPETTA